MTSADSPTETSQPTAVTPLRIVSLFLGLAEVTAGAATALSTGWIQGLFAIFVVVFPCAIAAIFFWILLRRPYVFYAPRDFTEPTSVTSFVQAHAQLGAAPSAFAVEEIVAAVVQKAFADSATVAHLAPVDDTLSESERDSVIEQALVAANHSLAYLSIKINIGLALGLDTDDSRVVQIPIDANTTVLQLKELVGSAVEDLSLRTWAYGRTWLLLNGTIPLRPVGARHLQGSTVGLDSCTLRDVGIEDSSELSVRLIRAGAERHDAQPPRQRQVMMEQLPRLRTEDELQAYISDARLTVVQLRAIAESLGAEPNRRHRKVDLAALIGELMFGVTLEFVMVKRFSLPTVPGVTGVMGLIDASHLAQWYAKHERRLLASNIRRYLKNDLVPEINAALTGPDRRRFAVLNNGVTIIAGRVLQIGDLVRAERALVVNGAQTLAAIHEVYTSRNIPDEPVQVVLRIIQDPESDEHLTQAVPAPI